MEKIEQIQLFVQGQLSGEPLRRFEQQLAQDEELQKMVAEYETLFKGFRQLRRAKMAEKVGEWSEELPELEVDRQETEVDKQGGVVRRLWGRVAVAAVVIGLVGLGIWFAQGDRPLANFGQENYMALAFDYERADLKKDPAFVNLKVAELSFLKENYPRCLQALNQIPPTAPLYLTAQHLKGHALYLSQQYPEALRTLEQLPQLAASNKFITQNYDADKATWTKLLAQLALYQQAPNSEKKEALLKELNTFIANNPEDTYLGNAEKLSLLLAAE